MYMYMSLYIYLCIYYIKSKNFVIDENKNLKLIDFATCHFYDKNLYPEYLKN